MIPEPADMTARRLHGRLLIDPDQPAEPGWIDVADGRIVDMGSDTAGTNPTPDRVGEHDVICPAFVDAHLHLPQFESIGHDGRPLLAWLDDVIFPAEAAWADRAVATERCHAALVRLRRAGTFTFAGYLTAHPHSIDAFVAANARVGLRATVGQVLMDRAAPDPLLGHPIRPLDPPDDPRLRLSVNPRFAVSCSDDCLQAAARLAASGAIIQTHLAESAAECAKVRALFPEDREYAAVYDRHRLLTPRTLLAHAVHLDDAAWSLLAARRCVVVHCPTANTFLGSGLFDRDAACRHGIRLALGSDVAAGPDVAMPRVARAMIEVAKCRAMAGAPDVDVPSPAAAWRLITSGNADALGLPDAGRLAVGATADLLVLRTPFAPDADLASRLLYGWDDGFIVSRMIAGRMAPE
ncbi:MAG: amidohydrolase family protein [Phycisphaerales bacterium]|nr:amidohydrolase family protein [Phycisphaerales bacterium]